jgi:processive 1,2-diacylglycerol beta-glucosyltransferase
MRVLFLSVSTGDGHTKAAEALKEYLEANCPGCNALIVDALKYISPVVDSLVVKSYLHTLSIKPDIYGKLYRLSEQNEKLTGLSKTINNLLSYKLSSVISEFQPSVIVCTHPFTVQMMSSLKKNIGINIPTVAVITDFVSHLFWKHSNIDAYIVAHDYIKYSMMDMGIPQNTIYTYGIPVSSAFLKPKTREKVLREMGFEDMPTCLLMGGSLGMGRIIGLLKSLLECRRDLQIIAVAGWNIKLGKKLQECVKRYSPSDYIKKVAVMGYTSHIADLMSISDFIITKSGGMTIAEALVKGLPIFIFPAIPGQEEKNAQFLINSGAAVKITGSESIDDVFRQTLDSPIRLRHMKEISKNLAKPASSRDIADLLCSLSHNSRLPIHTGL